MATVGSKSGTNDGNEPQYCLCNRGSSGIMIRCDNVDSCKLKWFHLECVGLSAAPSSKDKWYCPDCRGHLHTEEEESIPPRLLQVSAGELMRIRSQKPRLADVPDDRLREMIVSVKKSKWKTQQQHRVQENQQHAGSNHINMALPDEPAWNPAKIFE
ncbi:uncharacterized protein TRIVIDRAFT_43930 [Trichoderma virens Gv29-8]|uniref:PHD-type domain-containing protein n=1 Tax=Hypocrea virens (strain Gv29-8 / FGSC 10586) TaxID=413071 RepID=G9N2V4_HYPVG|nr:uncharacterized protein TRIVIDRAFT_43930 [Trichoderma virens Gv29-8]EHK19013.1 hypothetical protein TRIVIDRAFT_43930 [Trichoderma virens Gv29-8]